jgi:hypothetical protein
MFSSRLSWSEGVADGYSIPVGYFLRRGNSYAGAETVAGSVTQLALLAELVTGQGARGRRRACLGIVQRSFGRDPFQVPKNVRQLTGGPTSWGLDDLTPTPPSASRSGRREAYVTARIACRSGSNDSRGRDGVRSAACLPSGKARTFCSWRTRHDDADEVSRRPRSQRVPHRPGMDAGVERASRSRRQVEETDGRMPGTTPKRSKAEPPAGVRGDFGRGCFLAGDKGTLGTRRPTN